MSIIEPAITEYHAINCMDRIPVDPKIPAGSNIAMEFLQQFNQRFSSLDSDYTDTRSYKKYEYPSVNSTEEWKAILQHEIGKIEKEEKAVDRSGACLHIAMTVNFIAVMIGIIITFSPASIFPGLLGGYLSISTIILKKKFVKITNQSFILENIKDYFTLGYQTLMVNPEKFNKWMDERKVSKVSSLREFVSWTYAYKMHVRSQSILGAVILLKEQEDLNKKLDMPSQGIIGTDKLKTLEEAMNVQAAIDAYDGEIQKEARKSFELSKGTPVEHFKGKIEAASKSLSEARKSERMWRIAQIVVGIFSTVALVAIIIAAAPSLGAQVLTTKVRLITMGTAFYITSYVLGNSILATWTKIKRDDLKICVQRVKVLEKQKQVCERDEFQTWLKEHNVVTESANYLPYANIYLLEKDEKEKQPQK